MVAEQNGFHEMQVVVRDIVRNLDQISGLDRVWTQGVVHRGGPHYRLKGTLGPVSLGEDECIVFGRLVREFKPRNCFIIGNAFGMSSVFIAKTMEQNGGQSVITLDSKSEGEGERCFQTAAELGRRMGCRILANKAGWSPQDIPNAVESTSYDLIFIDGDHSHPQVTRDLHGVMHLVRDDTILCWHDYWLAGVPESVAEAQKLGVRCVKVNSSCEIVFGTRSAEVFRRIQAVFGTTEEPRKRQRPLAYLKLYAALFQGAVNKYLAKRA
jgi:predicted O-methyltransferase YrrM